MKAVVTGASGFIGSHLVARLRCEGWVVSTVSHHSFDQFLLELQHDQPDVIYHLAGLTNASDAAEFYLANTVPSARLLSAVASLRHKPRIVLAGSAAEYGPVEPDAVPVSEDHPCRPSTDYGISKYAQTLMARRCAASGQTIVVARIWNPVGPGMPSHLALASFANQIASIPHEGCLKVGNLEVERDFLAVEEVARILAALGWRTDVNSQIINVCSGKAWKLRNLVDAMITLTAKPITLTVEARRLRGGETTVLYGDPTRLVDLGLAPAIPDFDVILPRLLAAASSA